MKPLVLTLLDGRAVRLVDDVVSLVATDASGQFGLQPGHADLLTVLEPGLLRWRRAGQDEWTWVAGLGGLLRCERGADGSRVTVVSSRFVQDDRPEALQRKLDEWLSREGALRVSTRESQARLELAFQQRVQQLSQASP